MLHDFVIGEWNIIDSKQNSQAKSRLEYTAEFHKNPLGLIDGSIWSDKINDATHLPDFDEFEIAQIEIEYLSELHGRILNLKKDKELLSDFMIRPINMGKAVMVHLKLNNSLSIQITLQNATYFQIFLTDSKSGYSADFYAFRAAPTKIPTKRSYAKLFLFAAVILIVLQILAWLILRMCRKSIDQKIEQQRETMVIDLDKYCEMLNENAKEKEKTD